MNTDFYRNFLVVAQTGNITEAAEKLNLAQSALSKQIYTLEKYYGVTLLEKKRGRRQVVLTAAGMDFLQRVQELCEVEEGISLDMQTHKQYVGGTLRLSISQVAVRDFLEKYLLPFATEYPQINFQLHEESAVEQLRSLKNGVVDIAYANAPLPETTSFTCSSLHKEKFYAVYRKENRMELQVKPKLRLEELAGLPLSCNYGCLSLINKLCNALSFSPEIRYIATTGSSAAKLAETGAVVAVVAGSACPRLPKYMTRSLIDEEELFYNQTLFWSPQSQGKPVVKMFLEYVLGNS